MKKETPIYFKFEEFIKSTTAHRLGIDNIPDWQVVDNIRELAIFLDKMRLSWGSGIRVNSGYRCRELNKAVGGVVDSLHLRGLAADITPSSGDMEGFSLFLRNWLKDKTFDKCIFETKGKSRWIHFQLRGNNGETRGKIFEMDA